VAAAFYGIAILINHSFDRQSASDLSPVTFVFNVLAIQQWFSISSLNGPAWSVSAEFFAYLVFPLLAFAFLRRHSASLFGVVSVIAIAGLFTLPSLESLNPKLWQVFFEFTLGACAYKMRLKLTKGFSKTLVTSARILAFTGALTAIYLSPTSSPNHGLVAIFCAAIIILYSLPGEENSFLARRVLVRLGYWSYSLYLTHRLIQNLTSGIGDIGTSNWVLDSITFMALIGSAIALAAICFRFVEEPFRRRISKTLLKKIG
jgi:peptidoglycan/LPS O-acetylase OafA/YrhL